MNSCLIFDCDFCFMIWCQISLEFTMAAAVAVLLNYTLKSSSYSSCLFLFSKLEGRAASIFKMSRPSKVRNFARRKN